MPGPLKNERHERMAQEMAKGAGDFEAFRTAGFTGGRPAASAIANRPEVRARVAELLARAAARTEITVAGITKRLVAIAEKGEASVEAPLLQVARAALMDAAKLNGLIIDKAKTELTNPDGSLRPTVIRIVAADDRSGTATPS